MKFSFTRVQDFFSSDKGRKILIGCGILILLILMLSSLFPEKKDTEITPRQENSGEIEKRLEERLCGLISKIDGAGEVSVMVTLDATSTLVFEKDRKQEETSGGSSKETEVVLAGSAKQPLQTGEIMPIVRGAAVVCEGAGDPIVKEKVANTVAKALNIGISRVYVTD